jgi:hypothetical protein
VGSLDLAFGRAEPNRSLSLGADIAIDNMKKSYLRSGLTSV